IVGLSLNGDGTRIATTGADKRVKLWDLAAKEAEKPVAAITLPEPASAIALSPNGQRVAVSVMAGMQPLIRVYDVAGGKEILSIPAPPPPVAGLPSPADNRTIASAGADKAARLSDVPLLTQLDAHAGGVSSIAFHNSGTQAISGGADKTVKLWDLTTGKVLK